MLRKPKCSNGGMGGGGIKNVYRMKRSRLKPISKKQKKRTDKLRVKRDAMLAVQHEQSGTEYCCLKAGRPDIFKTHCEGTLIAEHVNTRNEKDADNYENLQVGCEKHNTEKGSKRLDCRSENFKSALIELDKLIKGLVD